MKITMVIVLWAILPLAAYAMDASHKNQNMLYEHYGKLELQVRYRHMDMEGLLDGSRPISSDAVFDRGFMISPTRMRMDMTMLSLMLIPSHQLHFMVMTPHVVKSMDHITKTGIAFTTRSRGTGDTAIKGTYDILHSSLQRLIVKVGVSFPTGSVDKRDITPSGTKRLPYPMQLGSGTFDPLLGIEYMRQAHVWLWGIAANSVVRTGRNQNNYAFGNRWGLCTWVKRQINPWLQALAQVNGSVWGNVRGADPALNPMQVPTATPNLQGGKRMNVLIGAKLDGQHGMFKNQRLKIVFALPIYQHLNGPQLKTRWTAGVQWTIGV